MDDEEDYASFWNALPGAAIMVRQDDRRRHFSSDYRREVVGLLLMLDRLQLTGGNAVLHPDPLEACDLCGRPMEQTSIFVDGIVPPSHWANMCGACFYEHGSGVGWGVGQLYRADGSGNWRLLVGSNPVAATE